MKRALGFALVVGAAAAVWFLWARDHLPAALEVVRTRGAGGALAVGAAYVVATVLLLPGSLVTALCGALYGVWGGLAIASPASVLGATAACALGRGLFRDAVEARVGDDPRFAALARAVHERAFRVVLLVRLSPVFPFNVVNYAFGLTRVPLGTYALASFAGMLPGTLLYVALGAAAGDAATVAHDGPGDAGPAGAALRWGGLAATVVVTWLVARAARKALGETAPELVEEGEA